MSGRGTRGRVAAGGGQARGSKTGAARGTSSVTTAARNIIGTPTAADGAPSRLSSNRNIGSHPPSSPGASRARGFARETPIASSKPRPIDEELRAALLRVFRWCDGDGDGLISTVELAAAQRLVAELGPAGEFDEHAATMAFEAAAGTGQEDPKAEGCIDESGFLLAMQAMVNALPVPRRELLGGLARQTSGRSTTFDKTVSELKHAIVSNVSNLASDDTADAIPAPQALWRTATGRGQFPFPPGAVNGSPEGEVSFKTMQYLSMRTEDASFIDGQLAAQMMGHRGMFKQMADFCGEILGVQGPAASGGVTDVFLMKSADAEQIFRVSISGVRVSRTPPYRLLGIGGFEPSPIEPMDVPAALLHEIRNAGATQQFTDPQYVTPIPPAPQLVRQTSLLSDSDLQNIDLVLTSTPVARHSIRIRFKLAGNAALMPAPMYVLMVPRLKNIKVGHACFSDHTVRVLQSHTGIQLDTEPFGSFVVANVRSHHLKNLVVEHEYTSHRVRVQPRSAARRSDILPAVELSPEELCNNLADDVDQARKLRSILESQGLGRRSGERDVAYAVRIGRALCQGYTYDAPITEQHIQNLPPLIWEKRRGDCSAFNAGFVYALRAFGVPARVLLGFKYGQAVKQACGSIVAPHAQAEFYAEGIGWIPVDATLGIKRLGHEASSVLSFVGWRSAQLNVAEAEDVAKVIRPASGADATRDALCRHLADSHGTKSISSAELSAGLVNAERLTQSVAQARTEQVLQLSGLDKKASASAEQFSRCLAAIDLGKYRELGRGDMLTETAQAGVKCYEGGPFRGSPLPQERLKENMMVQDGIEGVLASVNGERGPQDWSSMWPYGVFLCSYEFEDKPLL